MRSDKPVLVDRAGVCRTLRWILGGLSADIGIQGPLLDRQYEYYTEPRGFWNSILYIEYKDVIIVIFATLTRSLILRKIPVAKPGIS